MDTITDRITETERQALTRLLDKAKAEGIRLYRDHDGRHYASSTSEPGRLHYVTGYSCDCRGFVTHHRCKHHAAMLSALGWLAHEPDPDPGMVVSIAHASGHYSLPALTDRGGEYVDPRTTILVDGEPKVRVVGETYGLWVHWLEDGRPIDDLTGCTPSFMNHAEAVQYWIESLDRSQQVATIMQDGGLCPAGEVAVADPLAA